ncbi:Tcp11-domain-containing protein [Polyplosphaeria fusca]|uniref:Tcp11-domain-containing protein n=1 Tax=Polyplosphaeria fusca TaxID=682080 RepID=A0A9P4RBV0_9PLEO|nr:Tcp11-domain-containing protein [Polyplosphaeria fusca]
MTVQRTSRKNLHGFRRQEEMGAQTPNAAGSKPTPFRSAEHAPFPSQVSPGNVDRQSARNDEGASTWHRRTRTQESPSYAEIHNIEVDNVSLEADNCTMQKSRPLSTSSAPDVDIPEQLCELIFGTFQDGKGQELGEAFLSAQDWPPITKQSLGELDIQNIITNIKLRHDVSFDKDLSFRPNLDGARGQEKKSATDVYWKALTAELALYERLFNGTPSPLQSGHADWTELIQQSRRRIPKLFHTLQDVLKSLVPDRDHTRVDEHVDVDLLTRQIEKNVCDLPRLAEWLAHLLKEHCAPMRDGLVDEMVATIRLGAAQNNTARVMDGLGQLLAVLEAMKLDVANHQIRNLKTLLIEDTVNFERHYHLDRLVNNKRMPVNIDTAHRWFTAATGRYQRNCSPHKDLIRVQLEVFVRQVVCTLFSNGPQCDFPETFYLDQDRLQQLKTEIDDMILHEISANIYQQILRRLGCRRPISQSDRDGLRQVLSDVLGGGSAHARMQWLQSRDNIASELIRQSSIKMGLEPFSNMAEVPQVMQLLHASFVDDFNEHASAVESLFLPQILSTVNMNMFSSPLELFNSLVAHPSPPPPPQCSPSTSVTFEHTLSGESLPYPHKFTELSNRIAHVTLLHWRIWGPIAYVLEEESSTSIATNTEDSTLTTISSHASMTTSACEGTPETRVATMSTGDPPDAGHFKTPTGYQS